MTTVTAEQAATAEMPLWSWTRREWRCVATHQTGEQQWETTTVDRIACNWRPVAEPVVSTTERQARQAHADAVRAISA